MPALDACLTIELCIMIRVMRRHEILRGLISLIPETGADDLLDSSVMYVNARPKFHGICSSRS